MYICIIFILKLKMIIIILKNIVWVGYIPMFQPYIHKIERKILSFSLLFFELEKKQLFLIKSIVIINERKAKKKIESRIFLRE